MKMNKLRTFLTGMSMSWGLFILIILLGTGQGFINGIKDEYSDQTTNMVELFPLQTTMSYNGLKKGRMIQFDDKDIQLIDNEFANVSAISPSYSKSGPRLTYKTSSMQASSMIGISLARFEISDLKLVSGRRFNEIDIDQKRKVALIDERCVEVLFPDEDPIGKMIGVGDITMKVVGIYDSDNSSQGGKIYVPFSTMRAIFPQQTQIGDIMLALNEIESVEQSEQFVDELRSTLNEKHNIHPLDDAAIWVYNFFKEFSETMKIYSGLNLFLWLIGIGTIISGVVGVANIMLVTVKERTKEFGIRKAIGAKNSSIVALVLSESVFITVVFGYIGIIFGMGVLKIISSVLISMSSEDLMFVNPSVNWGIILGATFVMIIVALIAAYIPTKRAIAVKPVETLKYE